MSIYELAYAYIKVKEPCLYTQILISDTKHA